MKYTVITLNLNNLDGLKKTVDSVLRQTCKDYEYIVVDGGSTDGSKEYLAATEGISRWISEPDKGIYNAMNKGIAMAHGEYCIFMNSGDRFYDEKVLESVAPSLNGGDFYVGNIVLVLNEKEEYVKSPKVMTLDTLLNGFIYHQSTFTKTSLLKKRPYNEQNKLVSDWEKFLKEWFLYDKTYTHVDVIISYFPLDGISYTQQDLVWKERTGVLNRFVPRHILESYDRHRQEEERKREEMAHPLKRKIDSAMVKKPIERDCKILRNAFKYLCKDVFNFLFARRKYKDGC